MKQLKEHISILTYIRSLSTKDQKNFIKTASRPLLEVLSSIALNIIQRNIPLTKKDILKLRPYEKMIKKLSEKKHSLGSRRKMLKTGGFLSSLLSLVPTLISGVLANIR